jgi:hypothetical protein
MLKENSKRPTCTHLADDVDQVGKKAPYERLMKDTRTGNKLLVKLLFLPVGLPDLPDEPLTLLVCLQKRGRQPWYLLTNEAVTTDFFDWWGNSLLVAWIFFIAVKLRFRSSVRVPDFWTSSANPPNFTALARGRYFTASSTSPPFEVDASVSHIKSSEVRCDALPSLVH